MYRAIGPSHRFDVRDTVLHLEIINPFSETLSFERQRDRMHSARSIYGPRLSTYRPDIEIHHEKHVKAYLSDLIRFALRRKVTNNVTGL